MLKATIRFFRVAKCGFFLRGRDQPVFGNLSDTLNKLSAWASDGRNISSTACFEPDIENDIHKVYFVDHKANALNGDSVLILWNEIPNDNGTLYGIVPTNAPGSTSILATEFSDRSAIPGLPSYYWFIPSQQIYATIRFSHSLQGKMSLERYLNGFLLNRSPYRVLGNEGIVAGYSHNGAANLNSHRVQPAFHSVGHKITDLDAELFTNINRIRKLVKRETLDFMVPDNRRQFERLFSGLLDNAPTFRRTRSVSHEIQFQPTEEELRQIITNFCNREVASPIQNVGFEYDDGRRIMLSGAFAATSTELGLSRTDDQIVLPQGLLDCLSSRKEDLLRPLSASGSLVNAEVA